VAEGIRWLNGKVTGYLEDVIIGSVRFSPTTELVLPERPDTATVFAQMARVYREVSHTDVAKELNRLEKGFASFASVEAMLDLCRRDPDTLHLVLGVLRGTPAPKAIA
jgi:hypothetical protein